MTEPSRMDELARRLPDFVPDYATRICHTKWGGKMHEHAYYDPPRTGIHLCASGAFEAAATAWRMELSEPEARELWVELKAETECSPEEADFVADLFLGGDGDVADDFYTNRQLWAAALRSRSGADT